MAASFNDITIDELSEIYRVEKKSRGLSTVRFDLYKAMAEFYKNLRREYDEALRKNPDALMCEGVNARRKKCQQLSHDIMEMRMRKICQMALRGALGGTNSLDTLTEEEKQYYESILSISKLHSSLLERLSGSVTYVNQDLTTISQPIPSQEIPIPVPQPEVPVEEEYYEPEDDVPPSSQVEIPVPTPAKQVEEIHEEIPADIPLDVIPEMGEFDMDEEPPEMDIPEDDLDRIAPTETINKPEKKQEPEYMLLRMLTDVEEFAGFSKDRVYKLKEKQVVNIPALFGKILLDHNFAVEIKHSS